MCIQLPEVASLLEVVVLGSPTTQISTTLVSKMKASRVSRGRKRSIADLTPDLEQEELLELVVASVSSFPEPASQEISPDVTLGGRPNATRTRGLLF